MASETDPMITEEQAIKFLISHIDQTQSVIERLKERKDYGITGTIYLWNLHRIISVDKKVREYFSPELLAESSKLLSEWYAFTKVQQKEAYLTAPIIIEFNFPWFDHLDFIENLEKKLTEEEKDKSHSRFPNLGRHFQRDVDEYIAIKISNDPAVIPFYERKLTLEQKMFVYLKEKKKN